MKIPGQIKHITQSLRWHTFLEILRTFTLMHLADTFVQNDKCIKNIIICVYNNPSLCDCGNNFEQQAFLAEKEVMKSEKLSVVVSNPHLSSQEAAREKKVIFLTYVFQTKL